MADVGGSDCKRLYSKISQPFSQYSTAYFLRLETYFLIHSKSYFGLSLSLDSTAPIIKFLISYFYSLKLSIKQSAKLNSNNGWAPTSFIFYLLFSPLVEALSDTEDLDLFPSTEGLESVLVSLGFLVILRLCFLVSL